MKLIHSGRRTGKTTAIIEHSAKTGAYILVRDREQAQRVAKQAEEMGLVIRFPVTLAEMLHSGMSTGFVKNLAIDNLDMILDGLFPFHKIEVASITAEGELK